MPYGFRMTLGSEWWRSAVIYQIYPRSFADGLRADGIGDLIGITSRLGSLVQLGVNAVWLSPFFTSPQKDAGYDVADYCDVDPLFGTLDDFDALERRMHELGLKLIVDLVPNHTSDQHEWFTAALASPEGSVERHHYMFRDGKGSAGELPPNNWESVFGGPAWTRTLNADGTPGQWYLHLFDTSQPDLNWEDPWVHQRFREILRFWLDRGVDGFRVDVAHGLKKAPGLPDYTPPILVDGTTAGSMGAVGPAVDDADPPTPPYWAQDSVHEVYREWNEILASYPGERVLCAEAWVEPLPKLARWVRPDEMHQAFNFSYLETPWDGAALRTIIDDSIAAFAGVGAPSTWVLSNHDVVRHATRLALTGDHPQGFGVGPLSTGIPDRAFGLRRARAATLLMLALPGSAYLYQGEELGLPEVIDLPDAARQDPTWFRTRHERYGRDGCRVPIPWEGEAPSYGFSIGADSWLPQPPYWREYSRDAQVGVAESTLELYRAALGERAASTLGLGTIEWLDGYPDDVVALRNGVVTVIANTGTSTVALPELELLIASGASVALQLPPDTTAWLRS
jgi:alpha-glucosidase